LELSEYSLNVTGCTTVAIAVYCRSSRSRARHEWVMIPWLEALVLGDRLRVLSCAWARVEAPVFFSSNHMADTPDATLTGRTRIFTPRIRYSSKVLPNLLAKLVIAAVETAYATEMTPVVTVVLHRTELPVSLRVQCCCPLYETESVRRAKPVEVNDLPPEAFPFFLGRLVFDLFGIMGRDQWVFGHTQGTTI